ncbi:uncharacterized protein LOC129244303 [Anastrepha obliqua]|uniref:uncharacterized protein LOC129244303 n=1 Tax=Anastrepha obliqua TaxID=95512 RepID=UPI002409BB06|nr:uncharacterized protein LOC129244303 [Anastrepha obliqua]
MLYLLGKRTKYIQAQHTTPHHTMQHTTQIILVQQMESKLQQQCVVQAVTVDADGPAGPPYDLDSMINQLVYPNPVYQLHASALRNQLRNLLRERQLAAANENDQSTNSEAVDYDYLDEDKRSVAALAAQGMLHPKRSLATLAKNGQLPSLPDPDEVDPTIPNEDKRYVGALARSGDFAIYGKRNIGTLARDYQLPQNGKRNLATLARLGLLTKGDGTKRNMAAVARYNSHGRQATISPAEKRNIGALKGSPVHGIQQKRDEDEVYLPANLFGREVDYVDVVPNYWLYPSYADLDWGDFGRAQKRFLDTTRDPELFGIENNQPSPEANFMALIGSIEPDKVPMEDENSLEFTEAPDTDPPYGPPQQKRHIGSVYRSGFLPSYRALRSTTGSYGGYGSGGGGGRGGGGGVRFSRSGRARQFVEYYPPHERLRQPIAAVCKRCFLPYRPVVHWGGAAGIRGRQSFKHYPYAYSDGAHSSIVSNALPTSINRPPIAYASTANSLYDNSSSNKNNKHIRRFINNKSAYRARTRSAGAGSSSFGKQQHWGTPPRITALHRRSFRRPDTDSMENDAN